MGEVQSAVSRAGGSATARRRPRASAGSICRRPETGDASRFEPGSVAGFLITR